MVAEHGLQHRQGYPNDAAESFLRVAAEFKVDIKDDSNNANSGPRLERALHRAPNHLAIRAGAQQTSNAPPLTRANLGAPPALAPPVAAHGAAATAPIAKQLALRREPRVRPTIA